MSYSRFDSRSCVVYLRKKRITVGRMVEWCKAPKLKHTW